MQRIHTFLWLEFYELYASYVLHVANFTLDCVLSWDLFILILYLAAISVAVIVSSEAKKKIINNGQNSAAHVCGVHGAPVYSCVLIKNCWRAGADEVSHSPCCSKTKYAASGVQCAAWQGIVAYGRWKIAYCFVSAPWVRWSTWAKAERTWKQLAAGCIYGLSQSRTHAFPHVTPGLWEHE